MSELPATTEITHRARIAQAAADAISHAQSRPSTSALVGFDGFIDFICRTVSVRASMRIDDYVQIPTIPAFAERCAQAAGRSTNIETVKLEDRWGGNGPLMAGAIAALGVQTSFIGAVQREDGLGVHPIFAPFAERCKEVIPICQPSTTMCLEFHDGKLMLNDTANVQQVTWDLIKEKVGLDRVVRMVDRSDLIGIVNWSLLGGVPGIWQGLVDEVLPRLPYGWQGKKRLFIDLSDPAKRTSQDVAAALRMLGDLQSVGLRVTLGLNLAEAAQVAGPRAKEAFAASATQRPNGAMITLAAERIREDAGLDTVVIHPREGAAAATADGRSAWFDGPYTPNPKLSTGAGDHFNGGFAFAQMLGLTLEECLATAVATSGVYVRDAQSPSAARLCEFLRSLPGPEADSPTPSHDPAHRG